MGNNKFCTSCKYFEKSPDNCGRRNGKYGLCKYGVRQGFCPRVINYQHPICEVFKDKIEAVKCSAATTLCWYCKHAIGFGPQHDKAQYTFCAKRSDVAKIKFVVVNRKDKCNAWEKRSDEDNA